MAAADRWVHVAPLFLKVEHEALHVRHKPLIDFTMNPSVRLAGSLSRDDRGFRIGEVPAKRKKSRRFDLARENPICVGDIVDSSITGASSPPDEEATDEPKTPSAPAAEH